MDTEFKERLITNEILNHLIKVVQKLLNKKQDKLSGNSSQLLGFDSNGNPIARTKPTYTPSEVGALASDATAVAATKLETSRNILVNLESTTGSNFNGTEDITPGVSGVLPKESGGTGNTTGLAASATKLATARYIDGRSFNGTASIHHYTTCSTAAGTAAKTVTLSGFSLAIGSRVVVKFTVTNTADNPTLNVNSTGAKDIYYRGAVIPKEYLEANRTYEFVYNGTQYEFIGDINTDTIPTDITGNAGTATTLKTARTIDGVSFNGSDAIAHYATCSTAAATVAKVASRTGFTLVTGARILVKFSYTNTAASPTLNVNSTGAKNIYYNNAVIPAGYLKANHIYEFIYTGSRYDLVGDAGGDYLPLTGGTLTGGLTFGKYTIQFNSTDNSLDIMYQD